MKIDVAIIGGGPAGLTAAMYAARAGLGAVVFEKMFAGGQAAITPIVENYPGVPSAGGAELTASMLAQAEAAGAKVVYDDVRELDLLPDVKRVILEKAEYEARAVVLCTGATPKRLDVDGEGRLTGSGVSYCATCDGALFRGKEVAVIGGGNTALTDALYLSAIASRVHIIHRREEYRAEVALRERLTERGNIAEHLWRIVTAFEGQERLTALALACPDGTSPERLEVSGAFVAAGIEPQTALFAGQISLDAAGFVPAGEDCRTALARVYAAGDVRAKPLRQIVTAAADGANAAESARQDISSVEV